MDLTDPVARRRLKAYVWADQIERMTRLEAAIGTALAARVPVDAEDAVGWTSRMASPRAGVATVVFHSVFFQYMPAASQTALVDTLASRGARATAAAPFAWLRMEPSPTHPAVLNRGDRCRCNLWSSPASNLRADDRFSVAAGTSMGYNMNKICL